MSKRTYRTVDFQQLDWTALRRRIDGGRVVLAVDVAKEKFVATLMLESRQALATLKWSHPWDTRALVAHVASLEAPVEVVMEPTGTYGDAVRYCLRAAGFGIYRIAGKRVSDAKEVYDGVASLHDAKSAHVLGRLHLEGVSSAWLEPDQRRRTLHAYTKELNHYCQREQQARNRLEALLAQGWPEFEPIMGLAAVSGLRLLSHTGSPRAVAADAEAARAQLRRVGGAGLAADKIDRLVASAATTVGMPLIQAEAEHVQTLAAEVLEMRAQRRRLERLIKAQADTDEGLEQQAAAVGALTAMVLYAALGNARSYPNAGSYAKAVGLHLKERSSGQYQGQLRLTKRGPGAARFYLYFAALRLIRNPGPARCWYDAKVARDGGQRRKAIAAVMRKLAKALWHVGQGAVFDQRLLFDENAWQAAA